MITKRIDIPTHTINIAMISPKEIQHEEIFIIFLHEALGSIGQWRSFPQLLCDSMGLRGFILERQGHGDADPFTEKRNEFYLHNAAYHELRETLLQIIPSDKKVILAGHSDGGTIALLYASKFPKNVIGVISMAAHVIVEPETLQGIAPAIEAYNNGKLEGLKKYHGDKTEELFFAWADIWRSPEFKNWNISKEIANLKMPSLIIQGKQDQYGTEKQVEIITGVNPNATPLLIENCNHHPHLEKPERVIEEIVLWKNLNQLY